MPNPSVADRSAELLAASELRYRRLFEAAKDGVLILDAATGRITDVNPFLLALLGLSRDDVLGRTVDQTVIQCNIRDIPERLQADGTIRMLEARSQQQVVERQQLEEQFIEAQKMEAIGQLAAGVAHDFNNLLGVIVGYADILESELRPDSPLKPFAEEIRYAADRAAGLTRQLLVISRRHKADPGVLDLNDVVKDLDKMLRRFVGAHIDFTMVHGADLGCIRADTGYMGQLLMNLVVNARDAMPSGGSLTIETGNVSDRVVLRVSDTGTGMTADVKAHLFEPFFTTKPMGQGTGLGLATCHTIVQQSDGHIEVRSEVGVGTTFTMSFPRVEAPATPSADSTGPLHAPFGTETVMVVEDEPALRDLTRDVLQSQGYEVLTASNGMDGLRVAGAHKGSPIRLVITDVIMPLMGGAAMANSLRMVDPDLKVLFTSGYPDETLELGGKFASGVGFLPKPFSVARLCSKVRTMLDGAGMR
jgi:PAS domain S-box-containing protein